MSNILDEAVVTLSDGTVVRTFGLDKEKRAKLKSMALAHASYAIDSIKKGIHDLAEIKKIYLDTIRDSAERNYYKQWFDDEIEKSGVKTTTRRKKKIDSIYTEVGDLTPEEQKIAKEWLLANTKSLIFRIPKVDTDLYSKIDIEGKSPKEIDDYVKKIETKFANLENEFHDRVPQARSGHGFKYRRISQEIDNNYDFWQLSGTIVFKKDVLEAPAPVKKLIEKGLATSRKHNDNAQKSLDEMGTVVNNYYFCLSVVKLFNGDVEFYKVNPVDADNPFSLDFESFNAYGETVLHEAKEETCCICGEPINGYGNNPEPYKRTGRCCDACNIKFVIPARLEQAVSEEE